VPAKPKRAKSKSTPSKSTRAKSTPANLKPTDGTATFRVKDLMVGVLPATVVCGEDDWNYNSHNRHWTPQCRNMTGGNMGCKGASGICKAVTTNCRAVSVACNGVTTTCKAVSCDDVQGIEEASEADRKTLKKHLKAALKALG
jgi:hypothetical protein